VNGVNCPAFLFPVSEETFFLYNIVMQDIPQIFQGYLENWQFISDARFLNAALALLLATIAGFITGPRGFSATPFFWRLVDATFGLLGQRLDKRSRKEGDLILRGFLIVVFMILFSGAAGIYLENILPVLPQSRLIEIIVLSLCITSGAVLHHVMRLYQVINGAKLSEGTYLVLSRSSRIDLSSRDNFTITRTATELLVRLYEKGLVSPLIWYALAGLPGIFIYTALAAYVWKAGYDGAYAGTGTVAVALEKLMGIIPSMFAAGLLAMTTLIVPKSNPSAAMKPLFNVDLCLPYQQGGQPLSTLAYALGLTLGGPVAHLKGRAVKRKWTGPRQATAQIDPGHLKRVLYMIAIAYLYMLAALFGAMVYA
jgi:adenosylcobinamide-phosphate synthase